MVAAMVKAGSADPAKYLPVLAKTEGLQGRHRQHLVRQQGRRQERRLTLYTYKGDKREQMAVVR
jgi:branched-chain amino acid transport system substrate-binding protein